MNLIEIKYLVKSNDGLCANDFKNKQEIVEINIDCLLSITNLMVFKTPFSDKYVGHYSILTMVNNDVYYLESESYNKIKKEIKHVIQHTQ